MALRCNKPALVFAEDSIPESYLPNRVLIKRFSERSYIRETTDHLYALERLSTYIGKQQLPSYRGSEDQKSCLIIGENKLNKETNSLIDNLLTQKGFRVKYSSKENKTLPLPGNLHSEIYHTNLAIVVLTSRSPLNNYVFGVLQSSLIPTITLSVGDYPLLQNIPEDYQRRIISNANPEADMKIITDQVTLFEEDFVEINTSGKAQKYADRLTETPRSGIYTDDFRTKIVNEITMGDKYEASMVGVRGQMHMRKT